MKACCVKSTIEFCYKDPYITNKKQYLGTHPLVHFIIKVFLIDNECKASIGCLAFIFYQNYFCNKIDLKLTQNGKQNGFSLEVTHYTKTN